MSLKTIIISILILSYILPFGSYILKKNRGLKHSPKRAFLINASIFFGTLLIANVLLFHNYALASTVADVDLAETASTVVSNVDSFRYFSAALSTGLSCIGAGIAVASAASAALGALSENPGIMGKALIFVALAESIALYGLLISFSLLSA